MIPKIIHQTWKDEQVPERHARHCASWADKNPGWRRILWTDRMLLEFVAAHYPDFFEIYCAYPNPIERVDAARYMMLHHFGGIYADLDTECVAPLSSIEQERRVVLCHEPPSQWPQHAPYRDFPFVLFNGVMASPKGHPFWAHVMARMRGTRHATDVLDATGPCLLTGAYLSYDDNKTVAVHSCHLFTPEDSVGTRAAPYGDETAATICRHFWHGTWWREGNRRRPEVYLRKWFHRARYALGARGRGVPETMRAAVDRNVLGLAPPEGDSIAVLVPVRDGAGHIRPFLAALDALDHPKEKIKLVFCEGDSTDGTWEMLNGLAPDLRKSYRGVVLTRCEVGTRFDHATRWKPRLQRARRAGLARVRNHLIDHGLDGSDDWALWIDIDVWKFPADIVARLTAAHARIVTPNCVTVPGGMSYDMNAYRTNWRYPPHVYYRHIVGGLFQPPARYRGRLYLDCLRHSDRVTLDAVGGTMLLVDARLHRGGLRFPETAYKDLIETEAFGRMAFDLGEKPVGLPRVEILHVP